MNGAPPAESPPATPTEDAWAPRRRTLEARVHFEFDRFDLTPAAREILEAKLPILLELRGVTIRIEGHADERGSDEYNLILSRRRAAEVKRFLVARGVEDGRLEVFGYGEEQPAMATSNETAWAVNRRAEFRITAGGPPS